MVFLPLVLPFSAMDGVPTYTTGVCVNLQTNRLISHIRKTGGFSWEFIIFTQILIHGCAQHNLVEFHNALFFQSF